MPEMTLGFNMQILLLKTVLFLQTIIWKNATTLISPMDLQQQSHSKQHSHLAALNCIILDKSVKAQGQKYSCCKYL